MKWIVLSSLLVSQLAFANVIQLKESSGKVIAGVNVASKVTLTSAGPATDLSLAGSGLRTKHVAITWVKVYVTEIFSSTGVKLTPQNPLDALVAAPSTAVLMTFVRGVDAPTVQKSFKDALLANNVDVNQPAMASFLKTVTEGGNADQGKTLVIAVEKQSDGSEILTYEDAAGKATKISGPAGFGRQIFSIWLGTPADTGLERLKTELTAGN